MADRKPMKFDLKRKIYNHGKSNGNNKKFKRFKRTPKYIRDNVENKIAREKERDEYHFTDSEDEADDLGMGLELSDLPFLFDNKALDNQKEMIALTQDSVKPLFRSESDIDESKFDEALLELKYTAFRTNQKETIKRILMGRSTLFISPTGSGKSLCYQLPALLYWRYRKYITIVVSPLISLMEDQISNFPKSLKAVCLHSNHNIAQRRKSIEQLVNGEAQVAFISPEAIVGGLLSLNDLKNLPPVGFVCIDEAHCLSEWSHNFRPAYLQFFKILNENMKIKTYLGLTATATRATSFAIAKNLIINPENDVIGATTIPENLMLSVSHETNKERALIKLLQSPTFRIMTSIIVYCNRREETERVASRIRTAMQDFTTFVEVPERRRSNDSANDDDMNSSKEKAQMKLSWKAEAYHAGLSGELRKRIQRQFIKGEIRVVVATIAFGMGINKSNIRSIIHYDMPSSFESYVQEIGRAGRDGKVAQCHMFLKADKTDLYYQLRNIYEAITEHANLRILIDYVFKQCKCKKINLPSAETLNKLNENDSHIIKSYHKTKFTETALLDESESDSEDELGVLSNNDDSKENKNSKATANRNDGSPLKYVRKSIVKKHRFCNLGHPKTFPIEQATEDINLKVDSIITLLCQLQKAYPQLRLELFPPVKSTCNLFCYHGSAQLESLAKSNQIVESALNQYKRNQILTHGSVGEIPNKLTFDVVEIGSMSGRSYTETVKALKKTEWELVEKTGRFKRSQVRVTFEGNNFHIHAVGDLGPDESEEIVNYLSDFSKLYENMEREKLTKVYNIFKAHSIGIEQMGDKKTRIDTSSKLKAALNAYFDRSRFVEPANNEDREQQNTETSVAMLAKEETIRSDARQFIKTHGDDFGPRTIARIFQGISTPKYKAEIWGMNKRWWRKHTDVDFLRLTSIIKQEHKYRDKVSNVDGAIPIKTIIPPTNKPSTTTTTHNS